MGMAPWSMTTLVCSDVPEAMFVSAQAASNCNQGEGGNGQLSRTRAAERGKPHRSAHLKLRQVVALEELDEAGHNSGPDDLLDGRGALCGAKRRGVSLFIW